jgi:hypothetical protein
VKFKKKIQLYKKYIHILDANCIKLVKKGLIKIKKKSRNVLHTGLIRLVIILIS